MRTHGWAGEPPASDEEAIARIKAAVHQCVVTYGGQTTVAVVARELGVSRQTVYRYFPSTEALLMAAAVEGNADFLQRLAKRLRPLTDLGDALVEAAAFTIDRARLEPHLALLMSGTPHSIVSGVTSEAARVVGRQLLEQTSVNWAALDLTSRQIDDIVEWTLRTVQSFLVDPGEPERTPAQLRAFLRGWLGTAVKATAPNAMVTP